MWNLHLKDREKRFYHLKQDICDFMDKNWDILCFDKRRTQTWDATVSNTLSQHPDLFLSGVTELQQSGFWTFASGPAPAEVGSTSKRKAPGPPKEKKVLSAEAKAKRKEEKAKRKEEKAKRKDDRDSKVETPTKKQKIKKKKLLPEEISGKFVYLAAVFIFYEPRAGSIESIPVQCFHKLHSARMVKISGGNVISNAQPNQGYSLARTAYGSLPSDGRSYYYEAKLLTESGAARIGWANERAEPQAPVGFCKNSYGIRSHGKTYATSFGVGDVLGCHIRLTPEVNTIDETLPISAAQPTPKPGTKYEFLVGSSVQFSINGKTFGPAFTGLSKGMYYPTVSVFQEAKVEVSFSEFAFAPEGEFTPASQMFELWKERLTKEEAVEKAASVVSEEGVAKVCVECGEPTSVDNNVTIFDLIQYHVQCFRCTNCKNQLLGEFYPHAESKKPYCRDCLQRKLQ